MGNLASPLTIAIFSALIIALTLYAIFIPRNNDKFHPIVSPDEKNSVKILTVLGSEVYETLPQGTEIKSRNEDKIKALLVHSGNPWKLTVQEFVFIRYVTAIIGFIAGWAIFFLIKGMTPLPWYLIVSSSAVFGYFVPVITYNDQAKRRDLEFKKQLPDALDLINTSLTGGKTLQQAMRDTIPNMEDSVLKDEFIEVLKQVDTGKSMEEALEYFANRVPNESIRTFVQSMQEATELNVSIVNILQSRAKASREEFTALLELRISTLESQLYMILTPTLVPALLIILAAPSIAQMMSSFSS